MPSTSRSRSPARSRSRADPGTGGGFAVDSYGERAYDPSPNVLQLTEAAIRRVDDMADLRARMADEQFKRIEAGLGHTKDFADLRAAHNTEIRRMESDRVDKIRSVDVANAAATAAQLLSAVTTLATTAQATAETLRNQVAATAAAVASQTERVVNPIIERLALLEKSSNFGQGRAELANPALQDLVAEMKKISAGAEKSTGKTEGASDTVKLAALVVAMFVGLIAIGTFVFVTQRSGTVAPAPQIIYVPAPAAGVPLPTTPQVGAPR